MYRDQHTYLSPVAHSVLVLLMDANPLNTYHTSLQVCMDNKTSRWHTLLPDSMDTTFLQQQQQKTTTKSCESTNLLSLDIANNGLGFSFQFLSFSFRKFLHDKIRNRKPRSEVWISIKIALILQWKIYRFSHTLDIQQRTADSFFHAWTLTTLPTIPRPPGERVWQQSGSNICTCQEWIQTLQKRWGGA